ncbi:Uncharacterised protein [Cedecea davisae]|uniref:EpsG family protein n=1 Tax=Cedecea davisae DSM 4568 TaxID=566551 RepID=S3ISN3_9ENTR|nr:EpsG family protein [Cedecea davisae]EPF16010.1 hypothetical protein HMPREF0201_02924 [Cedecea davisae DSM 4568]SUX38682.1 Uncharacterised protein [Cedecea davisae]
MTIYLVILVFLPLLLLIFSSSSQEVLVKILLIAICAFYIFYHIDSGPDHSLYKWIYETAPADVKYEPIYQAVTYIAKFFGLDYIGFLILLRTLNVFVLAVAIFKLDRYKLIFFFCLYVPISFVTFELNLLRQGLAVHFGLLAAVSLSDNKKLKSYVYFGMAILSHFSSLLMGALYIKRINRNMVYIGIVLAIVLFFNMPYLVKKLHDYQEIGAINLRFDASLIQTLLLIFLPFIIFKMDDAVFPKFVYVALCLLAVLPVMVRLYPIGLLVLLPLIQYPKTRTPRFLLICFILLSLILTVGKTMLLLQADSQSIKEGVYSRGYQG